MSEDRAASEPRKPRKPHHVRVQPREPHHVRVQPREPAPTPEIVERVRDPKPELPPPAPKPPKPQGSNVRRLARSLTAIVALTFALALSGCATGNARLEQGGAYSETGKAPDFLFYAVESSYALALAAFQTASRLEIDNREMFWKISPDIKHALDGIRPKALEVARTYSKARGAYLKNPTPDGLTGLQTILGQFEQFATAAVAAVPKENP